MSSQKARIPSQSAIPGFSSKQWKRLCDSLTDDECSYLVSGQVTPGALTYLAASIQLKILTILDTHEAQVRASHALQDKIQSLRQEQLQPPPLHQMRSGFHNPYASLYATFPPAPRLVCVETNPGPRRPSSLRNIAISSLTDGMAALGSSLAKKAKKKVRTQPVNLVTRVVSRPGLRRQTMDPMVSLHENMSIVRPPAAFGIQRRSAPIKHSPFIVSGDVFVGTLGVVSGALRYYNSAGTLCTSNAITIDVLGFNASAKDCAFFPTIVRNFANAFLQVRLRKAVLQWCPASATNLPGSFAMASGPEIFYNDAMPTFSNVTTTSNHISTPLWAPASLDLMGPPPRGGLSREWKYVDIQAFVSAADSRQEAFGGIQFGYLAPIAASDGVIGSFSLNFEIEFASLALESVWGVAQKDGTSSSSLPSVPKDDMPPLAQAPLPEPRQPIPVVVDEYVSVSSSAKSVPSLNPR